MTDAIATVLETYAFTTEAKVKQQGSGIMPTDSSQDDNIRFLINAFSDLAMRYSEREFKTVTSGSTLRTFPVAPIQVYGESAGYVDFGRWDAQTITAVSVNTQAAGSATLLDTTMYQPVPIEKWDGVYTGLNITGYVISSASLPGITITADVTGTWGWPSVPDILLRDCVETVKTWLRMGYQVVSGQSIPGELASQSQLFPADLPNSVKTHLDAFKTITVFC
jgi:hypothetical protein